MDDQKQNAYPSLVSKLTILLIAVSSTVFVVALFHCVTVAYIRARRRHQSLNLPRELMLVAEQGGARSSLENSVAELIPGHKFRKDTGGDGMCAVCLCEYEEGEELRTLPECLHSFHALCIDMWLYSHNNCPVCRTEANPLLHFLDSDSERLGQNQEFNTPRNLSDQLQIEVL